MDFKNANELLDLCKKHDLPISEVMRQREIVEGEKEADTVHDAMARVLEIMKNAAFTPIKEPVRSMGGLIGGEAKKIASISYNIIRNILFPAYCEYPPDLFH